MAIEGVPLLDQIPLDHILQTIREKDGIITQIADDLGINSRTIYNLMESHPEVKVAVDEARKKHQKDLMHKDVEYVKLAYDSLKFLLKDKDVTATIFTLKSKAGWLEKILSETTSHQTFVTHPYEANVEKRDNTPQVPV